MKKKLLSSALLIATTTLVACGGSSSSNSEPKVDPKTNPAKSVQGQLTMPDGKTPLADATVYIAKDGSPTSAIMLPTAVVGVDCQEPDEEYIYAACTDAEGNFDLAVDEGLELKELKAVKGKFKITVPITEELDLGTISLPTDGDGVPRMAVVQGSYDNIENVLAKTGYGEVDDDGQLKEGTAAFDIYPSGDMHDLFTVDNEILKLFSYDIVFVNCGVNEFNASPQSEEISSALREYVANGGQLYVTDQAYDYVEQAFPEYIDFYGSDDTPINEPEVMNLAQVGQTKPNTYGEVLDPILLGALKNMNCGESVCIEEESDALFAIQGMLGAWAVMLAPHDGKEDDVKVWVQGEMDYASETDELRPLTVSFKHGKGKVIYTSYHTDNSNNSKELLPQERVLQFLVFE
ncbi:MAG TPA: hypothetical protein VK099_08250 [Alcanivoracaceae bacterium]|nr:hypothetical protein [Alcanivoracaceae bacterium]